MRGTSKIAGIGLWFLLMVASGCSHKIAPSVTTIVKDSLITKEVPRFVEVTIPGEKVYITEFIECDSTTNKPKPKKIKAHSGKAVIDVSLKADGKFTASGGCDSLNHLIEVKDKQIEHYRSTQKTEVKVVIEHEPYWFDIAARWIAGLVIATIIGLIIFYRIKY